jgi:branched-chain amino acid transport system substrate-binding protein
MMNIYFDAVKKVGDPTKQKEVAEAIGATDKMVAEGRVQFDPKTHLAIQDDAHIPILFLQIWKGERVLIAPAQYATGAFQLPPWMKQ